MESMRSQSQTLMARGMEFYKLYKLKEALEYFTKMLNEPIADGNEGEKILSTTEICLV